MSNCSVRNGFLGRETDRASGILVILPGDGSSISVAKGETRGFRVHLDEAGYFYWTCDGTPERTRPRWRNTIWVEVQRAAEGREITWACYSEAPCAIPAGTSVKIAPLQMDAEKIDNFTLSPVCVGGNTERALDIDEDYSGTELQAEVCVGMRDNLGISEDIVGDRMETAGGTEISTVIVENVAPINSNMNGLHIAPREDAAQSENTTLTVVNGCGHHIYPHGDEAPLKKGDPLLRFYEKEGIFGAISWALGDKKTMYCHQVTRGSQFATRVDVNRDQTFAQDDVWNMLDKRCCGRYKYDRGSGALVCGPLSEKDHDSTCNEQTCPFLKMKLPCPTPSWAFKE